MTHVKSVWCCCCPYRCWRCSPQSYLLARFHSKTDLYYELRMYLLAVSGAAVPPLDVLVVVDVARGGGRVDQPFYLISGLRFGAWNLGLGV